MNQTYIISEMPLDVSDEWGEAQMSSNVAYVLHSI